MITVLASGCWDLFHVAHLRHLQEARGMGDLLVVGVTMDVFVNKEGRPIIPQEERLELIRGLECVSAAILVEDSLDALNRVQPQIFCKGHDYIKKGLLPSELKYCAENKIQIKHTHKNPQTTTKIFERILCASQ